MKHLKFRAWDKENRRMLENVGVRDGVVFFEFGYAFQVPPIPMVFTGFRDIHCSEIFEGDIVKTCGEETSTDMVKWINGSLFVQHVDGGVSGVLGRWEIIGNIYETPELIQ